MSKMNKYKTDGAGLVNVNGERKQRDHTKKGIRAARHERRRQEAIVRQKNRIEVVKAALKGDKVPKDVSGYISTFNPTTDALRHAENSLGKIIGGHPQSRFNMKAAPVVVVEVKPEPEKAKSKYKKKKAAALKKISEGGTAPTAE